MSRKTQSLYVISDDKNTTSVPTLDWIDKSISFSMYDRHLTLKQFDYRVDKSNDNPTDGTYILKISNCHFTIQIFEGKVLKPPGEKIYYENNLGSNISLYRLDGKPILFQSWNASLLMECIRN
jgi:hypothetical protein